MLSKYNKIYVVRDIFYFRNNKYLLKLCFLVNKISFLLIFNHYFTLIILLK